MTYRPDREKAGFVCVWRRNVDGKFLLPRNEYEPMIAARAAALKGERDPFYDAIDLYGDQTSFDLRDVSVIGDCSPDSVAAFDLEDEERAAYKRDKGGDED